MVDLLHPGLLWLAALAVPLVLLYILKARRKPEPLTALWLWQAAQQELEARAPFRRLRRDWLLLLQLLLLALLVAAAAGPFRRTLGAGGDVAVVIDASASMLASDRPRQLEQTLRRLIDGLGPDDRMAWVRAAPYPSVLVPLGGDRQALLEALPRTAAAAAPADLAAGVELAESLVGAGGAVIVVTDPAGQVAAGGTTRVIRLGDAQDNVGIVALGVRPSDSSGRDHQVFVRLLNAGRQTATGTLRLSSDGRALDAAELALEAGAETAHTLRLVGPSTADLEVEWRGATPDALATDDRAFWVVEPPPERRYRLRGTADPFLRRALRVDPNWRQSRAGEPAELEVLIGTAPEDDGPPFLWIDPPAPSARATGAIASAAILRWDKTHPALRFVDLRAIRLSRIPRLERPTGARVLAESTAGPLILEGSHHQRRYLLWAFDPLETDLPLRVAWPLLVRNTLDHLAPAGGPLAGGVATGAAISDVEIPWSVMATAESATTESASAHEAGGVGDGPSLIAPNGQRIPLTPRGGSLRLPAFEDVGLWTLTSPGREVRFATSLLDSDESDLRPRAPTRSVATDDDSPLATAPPRANLRGLWRPLIALALVLLLLEAMAFHRRWSL